MPAKPNIIAREGWAGSIGCRLGTLPVVSLFKSASLVSLLTLASRITGLVRELLMASTFGASALTDAQLKAEIYSYSRSRGLFAGVALDGSVLSIDHDSNQATYGRNMTPRRIFEGGVGAVPNAVVDFRDRLEEYTAQ